MLLRAARDELPRSKMGALEFTSEELARAAAREYPEKFDYLEAGRRIAARHYLTYEVMISNVRWHAAAAARREFYVLLRSKGWSFPRIGQLVGRDHTTILAAVRAANGPQARLQGIDIEPEFQVQR